MPTQQILITGSSGFVGKNLVEYLTRQAPEVKILCVSRGTTGKGGELLWKELSVDALEGVDAVIHLAGKAHDLKKVSNDEEYFQINYGLTRQLYDLFLQSAAKKFIYISSVKAAADNAPGELTEDMAPHPVTAYGRSKLKAEEYLIANSVVGKDYYILRPCMIHGPGNKGNLNLLYKFAKLGIPFPLAAFANKRSFLSVENLCYIIHQLLIDPVDSGIYQVADDEALPTNELISIMASIQHKKPKLWKLSKGVIKAVARMGDVFKLPLNSERLQKLTESYVVNNAKIKRALNIRNMPVPARAGLERTIRSFQN